MAIEAQQAEPITSGRRSLWPTAAVLFVLSLLLTGSALSMWRPASYPRLRVLPEPPIARFEDDCGRGVERYWEEGSVFWEHTDFVNAVPCRPGFGDP